MAWTYLHPLWAQAKAWATSKVTDAVRETLTETPMFKAGRRAVPIVAAYVAASALLLSHALLSGTHISFASYTLLTAAACIIILAMLLLVCAPSTAVDIPLMATVTYAPLLAMQSMLAAFATCVHQENRAAFAVASSVVLFLVVHVLCKAAFEHKFSQVQGGRHRPRQASHDVDACEPLEDSTEFDSVTETSSSS